MVDDSSSGNEVKKELPDFVTRHQNAPDHMHEQAYDLARVQRSRSRLIFVLLFAAVPLLVVLLVVLNSYTKGPPGAGAKSASSALGEVKRYCTYTSNDQSDFKLCIKQTNVQAVLKDKTPAGKYARGESVACAAGAGRLCEEQ